MSDLAAVVKELKDRKAHAGSAFFVREHRANGFVSLNVSGTAFVLPAAHVALIVSLVNHADLLLKAAEDCARYEADGTLQRADAWAAVCEWLQEHELWRDDLDYSHTGRGVVLASLEALRAHAVLAPDEGRTDE